MAEAESLIDQRNATLAAAKSDFERGEQLVEKQIITQQTFDQRRRNYEGAQASVQGATAQRDQADAAIKSAQAEVERIESILHDLVLVSPRTGRVQYQLARNGEVVAAGGKVLTILDLHDVYMTIFLPAASAGKLGDRRRGPHHFGSGSSIRHSGLGEFCRGRRAVHAEDRGDRRGTRKADVSRQAQDGRGSSEKLFAAG